MRSHGIIKFAQGYWRDYPMKQMIFSPKTHSSRMTIVCFVSGSGTNYQRIVERDPNHEYVVFTNRPGCEGADKARSNHHVIIELSHIPYLKAARNRVGSSSIPKERIHVALCIGDCKIGLRHNSRMLDNVRIMAIAK